MLAVILTKSFRCLCFILKVYISLFFCVLELFLVQPVCGLPTSSLLSKGLSKGHEETLELCKWSQMFPPPSRYEVFKSSEQRPSDANVLPCTRVCGSHICRRLAGDRKEEAKESGWRNQKRKSCIFTIGSASQWNVKGAILSLLRNTKMLLWMTFLLSTVILQVRNQYAELPFLRHSTLVLTCFVLFFSSSPSPPVFFIFWF